MLNFISLVLVLVLVVVGLVLGLVNQPRSIVPFSFSPYSVGPH